MTLSQAEIAEKVEEEGAIHCLITFEVAGKPKEHINETLQNLIKRYKEEKELTVINIEEGEAVEIEDEEGYFTTFAEIETLVPKMEHLTTLAINFTPASIEILAPGQFVFPPNRVQNWLNDLLSKLHQISQVHRAKVQETRYLNKNLNMLARNMINLILAAGHETTEVISDLSGLEMKNAEAFLKQLEKEGAVEEKDGKWKLTPKKK